VSVTLDANVLVYAIDATAGRRHREASAIVERWLLCQEGGDHPADHGGVLCGGDA
jgi:hypothetical protein